MSGPSVTLPVGVDVAAFDTASNILQAINKYSLKRASDTTAKSDEGALKYLAVIYSYVKANVTIPMALPGFPFKSPNSQPGSGKVLGKLPDKAEELSLAHLNGLCLSIKEIYPPGAQLTIISDGLTYNGTLLLNFFLHNRIVILTL
jgi:pyoverdine/dityrosine biosynthesis protein Dit1